MSLFQEEGKTPVVDEEEGGKPSKRRAVHHMSTVAMIGLTGILALAIGANTWWWLGTASRILQEQVEETGRQAAVTAGRSLEQLQAASAANISRSADLVLEEPLLAQAAMLALLIETGEAAGHSVQRINDMLEEISQESGTGRIDAVAEGGRSYSSRGQRASQTIEGRFQSLTDAVMDGTIRTASLPGVPQDAGLQKVAGAGTTHRPMVVRVETTLDIAEIAAGYGGDSDRWGRALAEAHGRAIALTAVHMFDSAEEAGWSEQQIERRLEGIIEATALSLVLARTDQGGVAYEQGVRHDTTQIAERQHLEARRALTAEGRGAATLMGHLNQERYWAVSAIGRSGENLTARVDVVTQATNRGLLETGWQLEAERLATMEGIQGVWVAVLEDEEQVRLAAAAPRTVESSNNEGSADGETEEGPEPSAWDQWSEEHEAQARSAGTAGEPEARADVSLLSQQRARVLSAGPAGTLQDDPAIVVVQQEAADAAGQMREEALLGLGTAVFLIALLGGGTAFGTRYWVTRPIEKMAEASRQLSEGRKPSRDLTEGLVSRGDEVGQLARDFENMADETVEQRRVLEERVKERTEFLETANRALRQKDAQRRKDTELARTIQNNLVSTGTRTFGLIRMASRVTPARELGGDFVSIVERQDQSVCIAVCDVSGKGVGAALFMAAAQSAVVGAASRGASAAEIAEEANRLLQDSNDLEMFVTGVIGIIQPNGQMEYICAGHEAPIAILPGQKATKLASSEDVPMGVGTAKHKYTKRNRTLKPGETIVAYTDGIPDACNSEERPYGEARLQALVEANSAKSPAEMMDEIWSAVDIFTGRAPTKDDKTCLIVQRETRTTQGRERQGRRRRGQDAQAAEAAS